MEIKYSFLIGLGKSIKNVLVTVGVPAVIYLINNVTEWMPKEFLPVVLPLISVSSYLVKNYKENK